jgi:hypothetical protein
MVRQEGELARRRTMLRFRRVMPLALVACISWLPSPGVAEGAGPFAKLAGSWSGGGSLTMANGMQERLRCRAHYNVGGGGSELRLNLRCASESYNFDLGGDVESRGSAITGSWTEATRNASGTVSGRVNGDQMQVAARGDNFSASLSLVTRGNRQSVSIRPQGTEVSAVSIALSK